MYWFQLHFVKRHLSFWSWFLPDSEWISRAGAWRQTRGLSAEVCHVRISGFLCVTHSGSGAIWKFLNGRSCWTSESSSSIQVQNISSLPQSDIFGLLVYVCIHKEWICKVKELVLRSWHPHYACFRGLWFGLAQIWLHVLRTFLHLECTRYPFSLISSKRRPAHVLETAPWYKPKHIKWRWSGESP